MLQYPRVPATAYLIIAGVFPIVAVIFKKSGMEAIATYAHFFLLPLFFGTFVVLLLVPVAHHIFSTTCF